MHATLPLLIETDFPALRRGALETLQANLGYTCNQSCLHCHVNAGPNRTERMDDETIGDVLDLLRHNRIGHLDLTGGAPELNPRFRDLVRAARGLGTRVTDRCNLTILQEPGQEDLAEFLARQEVNIVASLPCYLEANVDAQRGGQVFRRSIQALRQLNDLGYGDGDPRLSLDLVYNPQGPQLPPPQPSLEREYKRHLEQEYGVRFNRLLTIANMPIQRFGSTLVSRGEFERYMRLLRSTHRHENLSSVMCRSLISIDWRGYVYDCDFNQMLGLPLQWGDRPRVHIRELVGRDLKGNPVQVADHCYGCTAGQGSSCGGALDTDGAAGDKSGCGGR